MMLKFLHRRRGKGVWIVAKEVAARLLTLYISSQRRLVVGYVRKLSGRMSLFRVRRSKSFARDRQVSTGYTVVSYAMNFDDGSWKEEAEYLRSKSFARRLGGSADQVVS